MDIANRYANEEDDDKIHRGEYRGELAARKGGTIRISGAERTNADSRTVMELVGQTWLQ